MALVARGIQGGTDVNVLVDAGATGDMEVVKLAYSAAGSETLITADASGLRVLPTNQSASAATETNVNDTASDTQLLASNAARKWMSIHNDSTSTLYVRFSASASSATAFNIKLTADAYWESGTFIYTGEVRGIWSADSSGAARILEA